MKFTQVSLGLGNLSLKKEEKRLQSEGFYLQIVDA